MNDRVFIDTNVFVYVDDAAAGAKRERARSVLAPLIRARRAVVSTQVMQEYFSAATRKLKLPPERARWRIEVMSRLDVVVIRPELILGAIDLHRLHARHRRRPDRESVPACNAQRRVEGSLPGRSLPHDAHGRMAAPSDRSGRTRAIKGLPKVRR